MKFRRIVFDFDGTLIIHDKKEEAIQIARILNIKEELIPEFKRRLDSFFLSETYKEVFFNRRVTEELYLRMIDTLINPTISFNVTNLMVYEAMCKKAMFFSVLPDSIKDLLNYLYEKGYELCVLTNGFYKPQYEILKYTGLNNYFNRFYAWDNFYAKPDKRAFYRTVGSLEPREVIMIGDDLLNDIKPAKEIGMYTIGYKVKDNEKVKPDLIISSYKELLTIL